MPQRDSMVTVQNEKMRKTEKPKIKVRQFIFNRSFYLRQKWPVSTFLQSACLNNDIALATLKFKYFYFSTSDFCSQDSPNENVRAVRCSAHYSELPDCRPLLTIQKKKNKFLILFIGDKWKRIIYMLIYSLFKIINLLQSQKLIHFQT